MVTLILNLIVEPILINPSFREILPIAYEKAIETSSLGILIAMKYQCQLLHSKDLYLKSLLEFTNLVYSLHSTSNCLIYALIAIRYLIENTNDNDKIWILPFLMKIGISTKNPYDKIWVERVHAVVQVIGKCIETVSDVTLELCLQNILDIAFDKKIENRVKALEMAEYLFEVDSTACRRI